MSAPTDADVVIAGGGLAGLCLARQLRAQLPDAEVVVLEPTRRPLPEACHKVGESSVELGSHYFAHVLGLADYLDREHLYKNGLRFFVGTPKADLAARTEIGPSRFPVVPSFQIDRGKFEQDLRGMVEADGAMLAEGWKAVDARLGEGGAAHRVVCEDEHGTRREIRARWLVDASGRRRWLARRLGLGRPSRIRSSAAWFRVAERVDVAELVRADAHAFHRRDPDGQRWLSTVHLCGEGYWIWIIPLSTGHTSIGIVADAMHPFASFARPEGALAFIEAHEPALAERLRGVAMEDFRVLRNYAHECSRTLWADRFALVGEAGRFVDPLYSPGSDLIAFANCFVTELVVDDFEGRLDPARVDALEAMHAGWAEDTTTMLHDTAAVLANPEVFA
ncbi:MAG: NAD(P)/FAD-dependent oxidoreductase, partial [Deltaproteobacteria bacterium]